MALHISNSVSWQWSLSFKLYGAILLSRFLRHQFFIDASSPILFQTKDAAYPFLGFNAVPAGVHFNNFFYN